MKVIGAGHERTGTASLKRALEQLGYGRCYDSHTVEAHPAHAREWRRAARGEPVDWALLLSGHRSGVDFPVQHFYKELLAQDPEAKVILTVRDPVRWYRSTRETTYALRCDPPLRWVGGWLPVVGPLHTLTTEVLWNGVFGGQFEDEARAIATYTRTNDEVRAHVPPERLLVYEVRDGWGPLCAFLGVPVPATPFPHENDLARFQRRVMGMKALAWAILLLPILVAAAGLIRWRSG